LVVTPGVAREVLLWVSQAGKVTPDALTADSHALGELTVIHLGLEFKDYTMKEG
jgi:hypothetical protein